MNKTSKKPPDRGVRYVAFKSYHNTTKNHDDDKGHHNVPPPPSKPTTVIDKAPPSTSSVDKLRSKSAIMTKKSRRTVTNESIDVLKQKGDDVDQQAYLVDEADRYRTREMELTASITLLESDNERLRRLLDDHEQLRARLQRLEDDLVTSERELAEARTAEHTSNERLLQLSAQLEKANTSIVELIDRVELNADQIDFLTKQNTEKANNLERVRLELGRLQREAKNASSTKKMLENENEKLRLSIDAMQKLVDEQSKKIEDIETIKRTLWCKEHEASKAVEENKTVSKYVEVLENERAEVKRANDVLDERNARLAKDLAESKKRVEQLRQKLEEINKENRLLKEKEVRYLMHERINVFGKYVAPKLPHNASFSNAGRDEIVEQARFSIGGAYNSTSGQTTRSAPSNLFSTPIPPTAGSVVSNVKRTKFRRKDGKNNRDKDEKKDRMYELLHRRDELGTETNSKMGRK